MKLNLKLESKRFCVSVLIKRKSGSKTNQILCSPVESRSLNNILSRGKTILARNLENANYLSRIKDLSENNIENESTLTNYSMAFVNK